MRVGTGNSLVRAGRSRPLQLCEECGSAAVLGRSWPRSNRRAGYEECSRCTQPCVPGGQLDLWSEPEGAEVRVTTAAHVVRPPTRGIACRRTGYDAACL